jgi:hypothetical protein
MGDKNKGGRPPNLRTKFILKGAMKELGVADVNLVKNKFIATTGKAANYHTIKKYLDQLVSEDFLRVQVVQDNVRKVEKGESQIRRRFFLYRMNQFVHSADKMAK